MEIPWKIDESYLRPALLPVRAETATIGCYELIALEYPPGPSMSGYFSWQVYGPPHYTEQIKWGEAPTFDEAKAAAEAAFAEVRTK